MLQVFADESTDETKERAFAVAGVIGNDYSWQGLQKKWLRRTNGTPFHANDCDSDRGVYSAISHPDNKALYRDLAILLAESQLGGWAIVIDVAAQRRVFPSAPDLAYYKGFLEVIEKMKNCASNNNEVVQFTFDTRQESSHNAGMLYQISRKTPGWMEHMAPTVSFVSSAKRPPLQAADLFAREAMKAFDNRFGPVPRPPRKSWLALYGTGRFHVEVLGEAWFEDLRRQLPLLEEQTGMSRQQYKEWLTGNKRQHNITSLFLFMSSVKKDD